MKAERRIEQLVEEPQGKRRPHPAIAGKMKIHGEIFDSAPDVPETHLEDLVGSTGYKGPAKSLKEMEIGESMIESPP